MNPYSDTYLDIIPEDTLQEICEKIVYTLNYSDIINFISNNNYYKEVFNKDMIYTNLLNFNKNLVYIYKKYIKLDSGWDDKYYRYTNLMNIRYYYKEIIYLLNKKRTTENSGLFVNLISADVIRIVFGTIDINFLNIKGLNYEDIKLRLLKLNESD